METDVLIIGAGPAGLAAAFETASKGLDVIIVDEAISIGGQLPQQTQILRTLPATFQPMRGFELAEKLIKQLDDLPIRYLLGHRVIGLYKDGSVGISDEENVYPVKTKKIIVATGAAENAVPFPKWTLPGVITIGAAQTLVNRDFVIPGKKAVIVGSSNFGMEVAIQLLAVGVSIKGIVENQPQILGRNKENVVELERSGVPFYLNSSIKEARGNGQVEEIDIQQKDQVFTEKVDLVCVDGGRTPILDCFYLLGCSFGYQEKLGGWLPQYNKFLQTDREDVFLAGNAGGISSQGVLLVTGKIAGIGVCEVLNAISKDDAEEIRLSYWKELEHLETKLNTDAWQGRINHIGNFANPMIKDQFIS
jgi:thioredoxin reductase